MQPAGIIIAMVCFVLVLLKLPYKIYTIIMLITSLCLWQCSVSVFNFKEVHTLSGIQCFAFVFAHLMAFRNLKLKSEDQSEIFYTHFMCNLISLSVSNQGYTCVTKKMLNGVFYSPSHTAPERIFFKVCQKSENYLYVNKLWA